MRLLFKLIAKGCLHYNRCAGQWHGTNYINMLNVNKQGFRSLKSEAMKKLMGGVGLSGCPSGACVFRGSYCQIVHGTCSGTAGDCYCTGGSGSKVESSSGCSATLSGPGGLTAVCYEDADIASFEI